MKDSPTAPLASFPKTIPNPGVPIAPRSIPTHPAGYRPEPPARTRPGTVQELLLAGLALALTTSVRAQTMPQDTWRYDNVQFTSTTEGASLRCLATASNGTSEYIYAAEGSAAEGPPNKVVRFVYDGTSQRNQNDFASGFGYILGIACDSAGNVYVLDRSDSKVKKFTSAGVADGEWDGSAGTAGALNLTGATGTSMIAVGGGNPADSSDDEIFVCDPGNSRIQVFAPDGTYQRKIGEPGPLPSQFAPGYPQIVLVTPDGRVLSMRDVYTSIIWNNRGSLLQTPPFPQTGTFVSNQVGAVTPDGLFVSIAPGHLTARDMTGAVVSSFEFSTNLAPYIYGLTVSRRGDVIGCIGNHPRPTIIRVMEREYASVQNGLTPPAIPHPIVLGVQQRATSLTFTGSWLDVDYLVSDADSATVHTAVLAFESGGNSLARVIRMQTLEENTDTNVGPSIDTGVEKRVTWNMTEDWSAGFGQLQVEVLAKDGRALLGTHWITVPADLDNNLGEIKVSSRPVTDAELLDLWYWLIATGDTDITFVTTGTEKGTVKRTNDNVTLAYSPTPTTSVTTLVGRDFLYDKLGVKRITNDEITRVQSGNYGFSSVTENSVVFKIP